MLGSANGILGYWFDPVDGGDFAASSEVGGVLAEVMTAFQERTSRPKRPDCWTPWREADRLERSAARQKIPAPWRRDHASLPVQCKSGVPRHMMAATDADRRLNEPGERIY